MHGESVRGGMVVAVWGGCGCHGVSEKALLKVRVGDAAAASYDGGHDRQVQGKSGFGRSYGVNEGADEAGATLQVLEKHAWVLRRSRATLSFRGGAVEPSWGRKHQQLLHATRKRDVGDAWLWP